MAYAVGSVHVDVVPSTRDFVKKMSDQILAEADKLGRELGERIGRDAAEAAGARISEGVEDGVNKADTKKAGAKQGKETGDAFGRAFKAEVKSALDSLPDVDLDSNPEGVLADIALIREQLKELNDKDIGVDLSGEGALAEARLIREELERLRDQDIDVDIDFDIDKAIGSLSTLEKDIAKRMGGAFENSLRDSLRSAVSSLPEIDVEVNTDEASGRLAAIRAELEVFSQLAELDLNIDSEAALADVARIAAQLQAIVADESIDIKIRDNADAALSRLNAFTARVERLNPEVEVEVDTDEASREVGAFAREIRSVVEAAIRNLPDIVIDGDTSPARRALQDIRENIEAFPNLEIGVDLSEQDALAGLARLQAELELLAATATEVDVRFNSTAALAEVVKLREKIETALNPPPEVEVEVVTRDIGKFARDLRAAIDTAQATLPDIEVNLATAPAYRDIAEIRATLGSISAKIDIDTDYEAVLVELAAVQAMASAIDNDTIRINFESDVASVIAQLAAAQAAAAAVGDAASDAGDGIDEALGDGAHKKISRIRLILVAVAALFPLIAGALLGITAAISLMATPIAAIVVGLDGIKLAVKPLTDELTSLKTAVSAAFQEGLAPAVTQAAKLFPALEKGLVGTAGALSTVASGVVEVITSSANLATISDSFVQINAVVANLTPAIVQFSQNLIDLTNIGASGLALFAVQLQQVAVDFGEMIARLNESGTAAAAIEALFSVLSSLIGLIGPLTELGGVLLSAFGPAIAAAINGIGMVLTGIAIALDALPEPVRTVVAVMVTLQLILLALGKTFVQVGAMVRSGLATAFTAVGVGAISLAATFTAASAATTAWAVRLGVLAGAARVAGVAVGALAVVGRTLLTILGGPIGIAITAIVVGLSLLGSSQSDAAAAAAEHTAAVQELSQALQASGGVIDSNIVAMTQQKLEAAGVSEAMKTLGLNQTEVAAAVATGGQAFQDLIVTLNAAGEGAGKVTARGQEMTAAQAAQRAAAVELLAAINPLRQGFEEAALANQALATALQVTGSSLVGGIANALALESAVAALGNASTATSGKVKALQGALDALNGGTVSAEQALANMHAAIDGIGTAFEEAQAAAGKTGAALVNVSGGIDTTTEAGRKLFDATVGIRDGMIEAAASSFDAAGGLNNVEAASAAAAYNVASAREAFISAAKAAGIGAKEAETLANRYGLIPELVTTLLRAEGIPQVTAELQGLAGLLQNQLPGTKEIVVRALSDQAVQVLDMLDVKVRKMPDGQFAVTIDDQTAPAIAAALGFIESQRGKLPVDADANPLQRTVADQIASLKAQRAELPVNATLERQLIDGQIAELRSIPVDIPVGTNNAAVPAGAAAARSTVTGTPAPLPVQPELSKVAPGADAARQVVSGTPAPLPIQPDGTAVAPAAQAAAGEVAAIKAVLTIEPGGLAFVQTAIANIRMQVATPVNFSVGVYDNASGLINTIRNNILAPANFTLGVTDNASATVDRIRSNVATPVSFSVGITDNASHLIAGIRQAAAGHVAMPVGITDNATLAISSIRTLATTTASMPIDANDGLARNVLATLALAVVGTTASMSIDAVDHLARDVLSTLAAAIDTTTSIMEIDADDALARDVLRTLVSDINGTTATIKVDANTKAATDKIDALKRPTSSTHTVNIVVNGQMPNAMGNILPAGFSLFANGGVHNGRLTPMAANYARIVQPNTFRVIGDRARDPEAYIPINQSPRSQSLLRTTAAQMGWGLHPLVAMASGGLLRQDRPSTQPSGSFSGTGTTGALGGTGSTKAVEQKLDQIAALLAEVDRRPASITVEDRSGDPVQTARATQLALRLAR